MSAGRLTYTHDGPRRCALCPEAAVYHVYRSGGGVNEADACEAHRDELVRKMTIFPRWSRIGDPHVQHTEGEGE